MKARENIHMYPHINLAIHPLPIIQEDKKPYMKHDQLFKELIHHFFTEFMEAFFPHVYKYIDFTSIKPLSEEMFTDLLDGESRRADIIIETKLKDQDTIIIVHVEPQSTYQDHFHKRMYLYFSLLYNKYRKPILPIAVFSYDEQRHTQNEFEIQFPFFKVLKFNFLKLELRNMDWRKYINSNNPVAAALLSKMGYSEKEKIQVKREFLRMFLKMELSPAKARFIYGFFDKYLTLNQEEEEMLMTEMKEFDESEGLPYLPIAWEEIAKKKGMEQGLKEGRQKGREEGREEGRQEGKLEGIEQVAVEMLKEGMAIPLIEKVTKLQLEKIEQLRKQIEM